MAGMKGRFIPKNPGKYLGNPNTIMFRSAWELRVMQFFDVNISVYKWGSEEIKIPYVKPTDGRVHHYYPDFLVVYKDKEGNILKEIVEVKPLKESVARPNMSNYDKMAYIINQAKWEAAAAFAASHGMKFRVITEESIFIDAKRKAESKLARQNKPTRRTRKTTGTVAPSAGKQKK